MSGSARQYSLFSRLPLSASEGPTAEQITAMTMQHTERLLSRADDLRDDLHKAMLAGSTSDMRIALKRLDDLAIDLNGGCYGQLVEGGGKRQMLDRWRRADGVEPRWGDPGRFTLTVQRVVCDVHLPDGPLWGDVTIKPVHWDQPFLTTPTATTYGCVVLRDVSRRLRLAAPGRTVAATLRDILDELWHGGKLVLTPLGDPPDRRDDPAWAPTGHLGRLAPRWSVPLDADLRALAGVM
ncbi:hypothetical protein [Azospirillum sp. sgz302134]